MKLVVGLVLEVEHLHAQGGVLDRGLVLLGEVKLALLLETRACVALTQGLEGLPMLGELLRDTPLERDDGLRGLLGLLVLRARIFLSLFSLKRASFLFFRRKEGSLLTLVGLF